MKFLKNQLLLFFLTFFTPSLSAQNLKVFTLEQSIDYALKNNIQIKQSELTSELSSVNLIQSKAVLFPSLNSSIGHSYNIGRTIDRFTNQFADNQVLSQNLSLSSEVTLFSGFQNINTIQQSKFDYLASKYDVDKMKNDIALNITTAYLQILYSMEAISNANNQIEISKLQVKRTQKLVDAGVSAKGVLLDIQSQVALEELNLTNAQNQLNIAYLSLAQLLNLPSADSLTIIKPDLTIVNQNLLLLNPTQMYATAISNLPEIKSAENKLKSAEKSMAIALGGLSPRLSFSASYGTGYSGASKRIVEESQFTGYAPNGDNTSNGDIVLTPVFSTPTYETTPFKNQYKENINKSFGFYLTIPLFNRLQTKTAIDIARIQKLNANLTVESTKLQVQKNIQQAYADANAGLKKYHASLKAVEAIQESFKYIQQKFDLDILNSNDYSEAKNKLMKVESDLLQAKYEFVFKLKVLDFYMGKPLRL